MFENGFVDLMGGVATVLEKGEHGLDGGRLEGIVVAEGF